MRHINIENLIQKYLDRAITGEESKVLKAHLHSCPECRALYQAMVQMQDSVAGLVEIFPRHDFNGRVLRELSLKKAPAWKKAVPAVAGAWFTVSLAVCLTMVVLLGRGLLARLLVSVPRLFKLFGNVRIVIDALGHFLQPLARSAPSPLYVPAVLVFAVFMFFVMSRLVQKQEPVPNPN